MICANGAHAEGGVGADAGADPAGALETTALILAGVAAVTSLYLQPLILGALVADGRLSATGLGRTATGEMLAIGLGSMLAGAVLKPVRMRLWCVVAALALTALNLATPRTTEWTIVGIRLLAGCAEGILLWLPMSMIARARNAGRLSAIFSTVTTIVPTLFAILVSLLLEGGSAEVDFAVLAALALLTVGVAPFIPDRLPEAAAANGAADRSGPLGVAAFMVLAFAFLIMASAGADWAYMGPVSAQAGLSPTMLGLTISCGLAAQVAAGIIAIFVADRLSPHLVLMGCALAMMAGLTMIYLLVPPALFVLAATLSAFGCQFSIPFQFMLAIAVDPVRRAPMLLPGMQLVGGATGPLLASFFVSSGSSRPAIVIAGLGAALGLASLVLLMVRRRPALPPQALTII